MSRGLALFALLLLAGRPAFAALCPGCDIVLVSFDALQASHVSSLGYERATTPTLDAFARKGFLFSQAVSAAPWTVPATMSWFTGTYPSEHRVVNKYSAYAGTHSVVANLGALSPQLTTLASVLKKNGYATGGFTGDAGVNGMFGFSAGFDVYSDSVPPFSGFERSIPAALDWVKDAKGRKFFLFLHGYDVHGQHAPSGGPDRRFVAAGYKGPFDGSPAQQRDLRERGLAGDVDLAPADVSFWRAIYDEKIARADAAFGLFVSSMEAMGAAGRAVFVLASDHGTELYEHRKFDHGATLYDELVRVPLVIVVPGAKAGATLTEQVSMVDLMPTLLDIVGVEVDEALRRQLRGRSLVPAMKGRQKGEDAYFETDYRLYTHKRGLRTADRWKFIITMETGRRELYDLAKDPGETLDLIESQPRKAYELEQRLFRHFKDLGQDLDEVDWVTACSPVYSDQCR